MSPHKLWLLYNYDTQKHTLRHNTFLHSSMSCANHPHYTRSEAIMCICWLKQRHEGGEPVSHDCSHCQKVRTDAACYRPEQCAGNHLKTEHKGNLENKYVALPVGSNSFEGSEDLSLLGFLSGGWSLLRMLLVLEKEEHLLGADKCMWLTGAKPQWVKV